MAQKGEEMYLRNKQKHVLCGYYIISRLSVEIFQDRCSQEREIYIYQQSPESKSMVILHDLLSAPTNAWYHFQNKVASSEFLHHKE